MNAWTSFSASETKKFIFLTSLSEVEAAKAQLYSEAAARVHLKIHERQKHILYLFYSIFIYDISASN